MFRFVLFGIFLLCFPIYVIAAYPTPQSKYVNDFAGVFDSQEHSALSEKLKGIKNDSGLEIKIVTVTSYKSYQTGDQTWEEFSKGLFRFWSIGGSGRSKGILFLIATKERKIRIQLGGGYPRYYDATMKTIIDNYIAPPLRGGEFAIGVSAGVDQIYAAINPGQPFVERYKWYLIFGIGCLVSCVLAYIVMKMKSEPPAILIFLAVPGFCIFGIFTGSGGSGWNGGSSGGGGGASGGF